MPEGHTLHRIARDHTRWFAHQTLTVMSPQGRFSADAERFSGQQLRSVEAYGKHLMYHFAHDTLHVHLGLYGRFLVFKNPPPEPRGAVRVRMIGTHRGFDLNGPNTCELLAADGVRKLVSRLGPDPLRADADPEKAWSRIRKSPTPIGTLLLNQSVVAGLGNIYRAEILHILSIHPDRPGKEISREEFEAIWESAIRLMRLGVRYNRIITVERPASGQALGRLPSEERLHIYKRPICPRCSADVYYWELGNRTIYACDACQV